MSQLIVFSEADEDSDVSYNSDNSDRSKQRVKGPGGRPRANKRPRIDNNVNEEEDKVVLLNEFEAFELTFYNNND